MTRSHHIRALSALFLPCDVHRAWNGGIFGIDVVLEPAGRHTRHPHNSSQGHAFEQELIDQLFGRIRDALVGWIGDKLPATRLALPFGLAVMNSSILDNLRSLTVGAMHRCDLPTDEAIPMRYSTTTIFA
jgi:hypothetical protein